MRFVCFFLPILLVENGKVFAVTENKLGRHQPKLWTSTATSDVVDSFLVTTMEIAEQKPVLTSTNIQEPDHERHSATEDIRLRQKILQPTIADDLQIQTLPEDTEDTTHRQKKTFRHYDRTPEDHIVKTMVTMENDVVPSRIHQPKKNRLRNERVHLVKTEEDFFAATWQDEGTPTGDTVKNTVAVGGDVVANSRDRVLSRSSSSGLMVSIRFGWSVSAFLVAWSWFV